MKCAKWFLMAGVVAIVTIGCSVDATQNRQKPMGRISTQYPCVAADLYFKPWSTETFSALTPTKLREYADMNLTVRDPGACDQVESLLALNRLEASPLTSGPGDARFVAVLGYADGHTVTLYADTFNLMTEDASLRHPIDDTFKQQICDLFVVSEPMRSKCNR